MSDIEKEQNPKYITTQGFLKNIDYKEAWAKAWKAAPEEDKKLLKTLPNFDAEVFEEITGIKI